MIAKDPNEEIQPKDIPACFYRISAKALVLDETRTKFLVVQERDGRWELPGGGIDHGEVPVETIRREIKEEMGLDVTEVRPHPSYLTTFLNDAGYWYANAFYETTVSGLNFTPSDECIAIRFVAPDEAKELNAFPSVKKFAGMFDSKRHR